MMSGTKPIRFLHIPKTAGTSINILLDRYFKPSEIFVFKHSDTLEKNICNLQSISEEDRKKIKLYRGHSPLITGVSEVDEARIFTFIRDPIHRVTSFCCHIEEGKFQGHGGVYSRGKFDLDSFLESGHPELENLQTKMLIGEKAYEELIKHGNMEDFHEKIESAYRKIEFVGVQDSYEDSLLLSTLIFGWKPHCPAKKLNIRRPNNPLIFSDKNLKKIRDLNKIDLETYRIGYSFYENAFHKHKKELWKLKKQIQYRRFIDAILSKTFQKSVNNLGF